MNQIKLIDGPVNIIRLDGNINNIKKTIYVFMDIHYPVSRQSSCKELNDKKSIGIANFFKDAFKNTTKKLDFFLEIQPYHLHNPENYQYQKRYIDNLFKLFMENFDIDFSINKVYNSKHYSNVRFHYADLRDYLMLHNVFDVLIVFYF